LGLDPDICVQENGNCESLSRNRWSAIRDFNSGPPKYKTGLSPNDCDFRRDKKRNRFLVCVLTVLHCYIVNSTGELVAAEGLEASCPLK